MHRFRNVPRFALILALVAFGLAAESEAAGRSVVAELDQPFAVNGQIFASGKIVIRTVSAYNPNTDIHELWVDNQCLGYVLGRSSDEVMATDDRLTFSRSADGTLVLVAFQRRGERPQSLYSYRSLDDGGHWLPPVKSAEAHRVASR